MSNIDRQRRDPSRCWRRSGIDGLAGTHWELPHAADLSPKPAHLDAGELADMMLLALLGLMPRVGDDEKVAAQIMWPHEAWEGQTDFASRHLPKPAAE